MSDEMFSLPRRKHENRLAKRFYLQNNPEGGQEMDPSNIERNTSDLNLRAETIS